MTVLGVDPFVTPEQAANHGVELVEMDELLARADVVTVHVPLTRATRGLIGRDRDRQAEARRDRPQRRPWRRSSTRRPSPMRCARASSVVPASTSSSTSRRPTRRCSTPRTPCSPRTSGRRPPRPRSCRRGGRRAGPRRPRGPQRAVRGERAAADARDGPGDRAVPAARRDPRPVLRPVLARRASRRSTLEIAGDLADFDGAPLTAAVLRGLLETTTIERVNLVNAGALAKARGITVVERKTPTPGRSPRS